MQLIEALKYLNRFNNVSPRGHFDYDFNDRNRNDGKNNSKAIQYISSTAFLPHQYHNNLEWSTALPYDAVNSRTVNTFENRLDEHWVDNPPDVQVNW